MITSKQRAYLRKIAHDLEPIFQIGKDGITDELLKGISQALNKRELVKVHILESALLDTKTACNDAAARLGAEPVQAIGNKFILYRESEDEKYRKIELKRVK
ncbi:MAG: ribosome assembly RNA-binding protein YhbY [Firmicutes bacterium]|nr:ribosome assembly RNA-binding protein YhbY [Bacillota bacterium]